MLTKEITAIALKNAIGQGLELHSAIQKVLLNLCQEYEAETYEDKANILNGIMFYAGEITGNPLGYREFDLIMSRSFPTSETMRNIMEEEGKNIFI